MTAIFSSFYDKVLHISIKKYEIAESCEMYNLRITK